jgi:mycothione reductase
MKKYDVIVIGSGCGMIVVEEAAKKGLSIALVEDSYIGGTCLNTGCVPSKMMISPADAIYEIARSKRLGVSASVDSIDFKKIIERAIATVTGYRNKLKRCVQRMEGVDFYEGVAIFTSDYVIEIAGEQIIAPRIVIACGTHPFVPDKSLIGKEGFFTSDNLLDIKEVPERLIIAGGGYIACEFAHLFSSFGTQVVILEKGDRLLDREEPEVSHLIEKTLGNSVEIRTQTKLEGIRKEGTEWIVSTVSVGDGATDEFGADRVLMALGRSSNAGSLNLDNTSVETDNKGFIVVDSHLETAVPGIYAIGDVNGKHMFRHAADYEAEIVFQNMLLANNEGSKKIKANYMAMPRAIFTRPQIAGVGLTESEAKKICNATSKTTYYNEIVKGEAMQEREGFVKAICNCDNGQILGCHIAGPQASVLIQEVVNVMANSGTASSIKRCIHIHPALTEIVTLAFSKF